MTRALSEPDLRTPHPTVSSAGLLRVAALPAGILRHLRFEQTTALLDELSTVKQRASEQREQLAVALYELIGLQTEDLGRRELIRLRRSLTHLHPGSTRRQLPAPALPDPVKGSLDALLTGLRRHDELSTQLEQTLSDEYADKQRLLKAHFRNDRLLDAVDLASPNLYPFAQAYADRAVQGPGWTLTSERKLEHGLLTYLARATVKTSPLGRFMHSVDLRFDGPASSVPWTLRCSANDFVSVATLSDYGLRLLATAALQDSEIAAGLPLELSPDLSRDGESWTLYASQYPASLKSSHLRVPATPALNAMLAAFRRSTVNTGGRLSPDLRPLLQTLGVNPDEADQVIRVQRIILQLRNLGVLRISLSVLDAETDPLTRLAHLLGSVPGPAAAELARDVRLLASDLANYGRLHGPARRAHGEAIRETLNRVSERHRVPALTGVLHRRGMYESSHQDTPPQRVRPPFGGQDLDVRALTQWIGVFNTNAVPDYLEELFLEEYGVGGTCQQAATFVTAAIPALRAAMGFGATPGELQAPRRADPGVQARVTALRERRSTRRALRSALIERLAERLADASGTVHLEPQEVLTWCAGHRSQVRAMTLFTQGLPDGKQIVSGAYLGHSTVLRAMAQHGGMGPRELAEVREALEQLYAPALPAQLIVKSGNPVNYLPGVTSEVICSPGTRCSGPDVHPLASLHLQHEPNGGLHFVTEQGRHLVPLYLGVLVPMFLAPTDWLLASVTPTLQYRPNLALEVDDRAPSTTVWHLPRVECGRFVLARHTWVIPEGYSLRRQPGEREAAYWLRLRAWQDEAGIPRQFFASPDPTWLQSMLQVLDGTGGQAGRAKPQYFDFDSFLFIRNFEKWAEDVDGTRWSLQEVWPDVGDAFIFVDGEAHVSEFAVDLWQRPEEHP